MDIQGIKQIGYYDDVVINGYINPLNHYNGISIHQRCSLNESMQLNDSNHYNSVSRLHIAILGCIDDKQYTVAYADILLMNSPDVLDIKKDEISDIHTKISKSPDELELFYSGAVLASIIKKNRPLDSMVIAIIDRVYVHQKYRHLGISTWIHKNIVDIIRKFTLKVPDAIALAYGDFSDEAKDFGMSFSDYKKYLHDMYKNLEYKDISMLCKFTCKPKLDIMYKLVEKPNESF